MCKEEMLDCETMLVLVNESVAEIGILTFLICEALLTTVLPNSGSRFHSCFVQKPEIE